MAAHSTALQEGWRAIGVSVTGAGHERAGLPCQDAHRYLRTPSGLFLAAVADGAGSAERASEGAALAVQVAIGFLERNTGGQEDWTDASLAGLFRGAIEEIRNQATAYAERENISLDALSSTLILTVSGSEFAAAAQIGDGAVVAEDASGHLETLTRPDSGEFINETTFLTAPDAMSRIQTNVWRGRARHVCLFSDGLQMLALRMPEAEPHAGFFRPLFRFVAQTEDPETLAAAVTSFVSSGRIRERTDDDVTLVVSTYLGS